jgi:hypothetical protein
MGILHEVTIDDKFFDITLEDIAQRVQDQRAEFEKKVQKKIISQEAYQQEKVFIKEA